MAGRLTKWEPTRPPKYEILGGVESSCWDDPQEFLETEPFDIISG